MAEKKTYADVLSGGKIGTYKEATGGGTPLEKGEKLKDHPEAHRVQQPRDEEGKFTYNSANAKELKYGPSRGTTVPPFLRGIKLNYAIKKGDRIVSESEGKKHIYVSEMKMSAEDLINTFKQYFGSEVGFKGLMNKAKGKVGAQSKIEKAAPATSILGRDSKKTTVELGQYFQKKKENGKTPKFMQKKQETPKEEPKKRNA